MLPAARVFRPTYCLSVGECYGSVLVHQSDVEVRFHGRLIEAGESLPGVCRLHLGGGNNPDRKQKEQQLNTFG